MTDVYQLEHYQYTTGYAYPIHLNNFLGLEYTVYPPQIKLIKGGQTGILQILQNYQYNIMITNTEYKLSKSQIYSGGCVEG